ncbi:hypothetical protein NYE44_30480 [Paenibacillus sp. FSL L8-0493]|uniref:hypothetical protein n=1 Tax=Paenibacillus sp. FSL L8-0493 TaxID=2975333 RepID=UPI0030FDECD8
MRRRVKEDLIEYRFTIIMIVVLVGVITGSYFMIKYGNEQDRESARIDKETAFQVEGVITGMKTSFTKRKSILLGTVTDKTKYVQVDDREFEISDYLLGEINKGDHVKVSGKRGIIEELEVTH